MAGLAMDVDQVQFSSETKNNCYQDWLAYQRKKSIKDIHLLFLNRMGVF